MFKPDDSFHMPKASWRFHLLSPSIRADDAQSLVMSDLYSKSLHSRLTELTYPASYAGLHFGASTGDRGLHIELDGFNQKGKVLLERSLGLISHFTPTREEFDTNSEALHRAYKNTTLSPPVSQASRLMSEAVWESYVPDHRKLVELNSITFEDLTAFSKSIVSSRVIDGLCVGSITESEAMEAWALVNRLLPGVPCSRGKQ